MFVMLLQGSQVKRVFFAHLSRGCLRRATPADSTLLRLRLLRHLVFLFKAVDSCVATTENEDPASFPKG